MDAQCPARGAGLSHTWRKGQCVECGVSLRSREEESGIGGYHPSDLSAGHPLPEESDDDIRWPGAPPYMSIADRLKAMGLVSDSGQPVQHGVLRGPDTLIERRAITGDGPQGDRWGRGRGELTERDKQRVIFYVAWVRDPTDAE